MGDAQAGSTTPLGTFGEQALEGSPSWGNLNMKTEGVSDAPFGLAWIQLSVATTCL